MLDPSTRQPRRRAWRIAGKEALAPAVVDWPEGFCSATASREVVGYCWAFGAWRSLVARTVRVGEVPSSNLGAPIKEPLLTRGFLRSRDRLNLHARVAGA